MKRKIDWDEEEESGQEDSTASDEESDSEEPRTKDVLNNPSQAVSRKYASELLHSMTTYLVLDTPRAVTPKSTYNTSNKHLGTG